MEDVEKSVESTRSSLSGTTMSWNLTRNPHVSSTSHTGPNARITPAQLDSLATYANLTGCCPFTTLGAGILHRVALTTVVLSSHHALSSISSKSICFESIRKINIKHSGSD